MLEGLRAWVSWGWGSELLLPARGLGEDYEVRQCCYHVLMHFTDARRPLTEHKTFSGADQQQHCSPRPRGLPVIIHRPSQQSVCGMSATNEARFLAMQR